MDDIVEGVSSSERDSDKGGPLSLSETLTMDDDTDPWILFDRHLHELDDVYLAPTARRNLEMWSNSFSVKERLLKACEALTWYKQSEGTCFLLQQLVGCVLAASVDQRKSNDILKEVLQAVKSVFRGDNDDDDGDNDGEIRVRTPAVFEEALRVVDALIVSGSERSAICEALLECVGAHSGSMSEELLRLFAFYVAKASSTPCAFLLDDVDDADADDDYGDSRLVPLLLHGIGTALFPTYVLSPLFALQCVLHHIRVGCSQGDPRAVTLYLQLLNRLPNHSLCNAHAWMSRIIQALVQFCVTMPNENHRATAWKAVNLSLDKQETQSAAQCLAAVLSSCPHANAVGLLITRVKNELMGSCGQQWMQHCKHVLFALIFRLPLDGAELVTRHDAVMSAANLLLFLTLRKSWSDEDHISVAKLRDMWVPPLRSMLTTQLALCRQPVNNIHLKELVQKCSGGMAAPTDAHYLEAAQRISVSTELLLSIVMRIEEFSY